MDQNQLFQRSDFDIWLRTGRRPMGDVLGPIEVKFNPWHHVLTGRFTFRNTGRYFAIGSRAAAKPASSARTARPAKPSGGERFGGAGATGSWGAPAPPKPQKRPKPDQRQMVMDAAEVAASAKPSVRSAPPAPAKPEPVKLGKTVFGDAQVFKMDDLDRTTFVSAQLKLADTPKRSRRVQSAAGIPDRKPTDDGGQYIAPRFNGPSEAFNHFAQNRTINRGRYRVMEDQWAKALKQGKKVYVEIRPIYEGSSKRPFRLDLKTDINGQISLDRIPND